MKNYLSLNRFSLLYDHYAIIDVPEYYADQLFIRHQVTVRFGKESNARVRRYMDLPCKGNSYRRVFDYWWTLY